jgi:hypothetical protein
VSDNHGRPQESVQAEQAAVPVAVEEDEQPSPRAWLIIITEPCSIPDWPIMRPRKRAAQRRIRRRRNRPD